MFCFLFTKIPFKSCESPHISIVHASQQQFLTGTPQPPPLHIRPPHNRLYRVTYGRFVTYDGIQCYPEYLICYERVFEDDDCITESKSSENVQHESLSTRHSPSSAAMTESKMTETQHARQMREKRQRMADLGEEVARGQVSLLELQNLNDWYTFQISEHEKRIRELQGKAETNLFTLTFTVPELERAFRIAHMRTCLPCVLLCTISEI